MCCGGHYASTLLASPNGDRIVLLLVFHPEIADSVTLLGVSYLNESNLFVSNAEADTGLKRHSPSLACWF